MANTSAWQKFLHIDEAAQTMLAEGEAILEREGNPLKPGEPADWSRIFKATAADPETDIELKTENGESIFVFLAVMVKDGNFTQFWTAFLCSEQNSEYLLADQAAYHKKVQQYLKAGHTPRSGGPN